MWQYMWKNDQTYEKKGSYDWDGEQTPDDPKDDCESTSWKNYTDEWQNPHRHPLNQVYRKIDRSRPTLQCLIEKGLIEFDGD